MLHQHHEGKDRHQHQLATSSRPAQEACSGCCCASPTNSLNSEILARLFESFERSTEAKVQELEQKVKEMEAYAIQEITRVQETAVIQIKRVEDRAEKLTQEMESSLAKTLELQRRAEAKLK